MEKFFGTDGVRGVANRDLTPELAMYIGQAAACHLVRQGTYEGPRAKIIIGRDTRVSGGMLEAALAAGICSMGVDVWLAGVVPTPAVAFLTRTYEACAGVVISASHNPAPDNGIKFFSNLGYKFPDDVEEDIEVLIRQGIATGVMTAGERPVGSGVGRIVPMKQAEERYMEFLKATAPSLEGLTVVVDCANGAAGSIAPKLFAELGACVIPVFDSADGMSINVLCGSTHPETLAQKVLACHADLGLAFDGDADRVIAVDENGKIVDGDAIMLICALSMKERRSLKKDTLVLTVMSNLGLRRALLENGIKIEETAVGDRYVLERLIESGAALGGEQSGHIIFTDYAKTGDGMLSALKLMEVIQIKKKKLSELASCFTQYPQVIQNTHVKDKAATMNHPDVIAAIAQAQERLGADGRVLVRPSGTEPMIRVMLEGPNKDELDAIAQEVIDKIDAVQ
ncbi:MAG: phosphoglucosamine mutase [Peptococcaceae bacterium]|nr:phosphoglucosamine mutase [Peptococcaceae bacterium]